MPSTAEVIATATQQKQAAIAALDQARSREQQLKLQLGRAVAAGAVTTNVKQALAAVRDEVEGLTAALPVYDATIAAAEDDAKQTARLTIRDQLDVVIAKRREAAQAAQLAMSDLVDAVNQVAALGRQTVSLASQLRRPYPDRLGNHHLLPLWLAANVLACSPDGLARWPSAGADPWYASAGLPSLEEETLSREGL